MGNPKYRVGLVESNYQIVDNKSHIDGLGMEGN